jgi:hypothetical protein
MFKRYKVRLLLVLVTLLVEGVYAFFMFKALCANTAFSAIEYYLSVFTIASIIYFLMLDAFSRDKYLYFEPRLKHATLFVYGSGVFGLVVTLIIYIFSGQAHMGAMIVSIVAWFIALISLIYLTFMPSYRVVK